MEINHGGGTARGLVLLIGGAPGGKRRQPVRPEAALGLLATLPPEALLGSPIPASVLQLADPADPQLLLAHLQTAARTPGPVLVALVGQLTADRRRKELHLALAQTTRDNVRYTALPWAWLADQLRSRPAGTTTVLADLVADPDAWAVLHEHGPDALTAGLPLVGQVSPPGTTGDGYAPPYTRALVDHLRRAEPGTRAAGLHHLAGHSGLPAGAVLLAGEVPVAAAQNSESVSAAPLVATVAAATSDTTASTASARTVETTLPREHAGTVTAAAGPGPALTRPTGAVGVPMSAVPTPAMPTPTYAAPVMGQPRPVPAQQPRASVPVTAAPALPAVGDGPDPRPAVAAALHAGDLPRAAYLIADWERMLLRHQGPRTPLLADVAEAQAQLALATADLGRATERLIEAARLRMQQLPPQDPVLGTAVDNAVAIWGRLPRDVALRHGAALLALCRALPAGGVRVREVEARLAELTERTGLLRRGR